MQNLQKLAIDILGKTVNNIRRGCVSATVNVPLESINKDKVFEAILNQWAKKQLFTFTVIK